LLRLRRLSTKPAASAAFTMPFSRIDNAQVQVWLKNAAGGSDANKIQKLFAVNYNILRIQSGMGGLAFSN